MVDLDEIAQRLIKGEAEEVSRLTREALEQGVAPTDILEEGLISGMSAIAWRFRENLIFLPEVLVSARAMKAGMAILEPILSAYDAAPAGRIVIGTVHGDIHDIGKNLVIIMLRGAGFRVVDLGANVSLQRFLAAIEEHQPDIVAMSALLSTTMIQMRANIEAFGRAGVVGRVRVMVGGAPVSGDYARAIGADGYARDAATAVTRALELIEISREVSV